MPRKSTPITDKGNDLIDALLQKTGLKNDAKLAVAMELAPPVISKIRHRRLPICAGFLINAHEVSGMSIKYMKEIAGLKEIPAVLPQ